MGHRRNRTIGFVEAALEATVLWVRPLCGRGDGVGMAASRAPLACGSLKCRRFRGFVAAVAAGCGLRVSRGAFFSVRMVFGKGLVDRAFVPEPDGGVEKVLK